MSVKHNNLNQSIQNLIHDIGAVIGESMDLEKAADMAQVLVHYQTTKELYAELDSARKTLHHRIDGMEKAGIPKMMEAQGVDKVAVPEIKRSFYVLTKHSASMVDKLLGMEWLRGNDLGETISETVNAGTLAKVLKEYILETGKEPPEDAFKLTKYNTIGSSKYNPK